MGTLNLCFKVPEQMQKIRNQSNHHRLINPPKTVKNQPNSVVFGRFPSLDWPDSSLVTRVPTRHTLKKLFSCLIKEVRQFFKGARGGMKYLRERAEIRLVAPDTQFNGKMHSANSEPNFLDF